VLSRTTRTKTAAREYVAVIIQELTWTSASMHSAGKRVSVTERARTPRSRRACLPNVPSYSRQDADMATGSRTPQRCAIYCSRAVPMRRSFITLALGATITILAAGVELAQVPGTRILGGCDVPVAQRTSDTGCYLTATLALPELPSAPIYWHVFSYPSRAVADSVPLRPASIVVESLGASWLFAIGDAAWQASVGQRVARVGPLPVTTGARYTARFMEAVFPPGQGLQTSVHRHSGPEAWFVVSGAQCLRTPETTTVLRKGEGGFVAAGPPMMLTGLGPDIRRALVLVLHDSEKPWMTVATDWLPTVSCPEN